MATCGGLNLNCSGQFRIIEALITVILVIGSMTIAINIQRIPSSWIIYSREELDDMAFNLLDEISVPTISNILSNQTGKWEYDISLLLGTLLPKTVYFNMTIYEFTPINESTITMRILNRFAITNIPGSFVMDISESGSATYIFTSSDGRIYMLVLTLIRVKG